MQALVLVERAVVRSRAVGERLHRRVNVARRRAAFLVHPQGVLSSPLYTLAEALDVPHERRFRLEEAFALIRGAPFRVGERGAHRVARSRLGFAPDRLGFASDRLGFFFRGVLLRLGVLERRGELREGHLRVLELHSRPVRLRLRGLRLRRHQRRSRLRVGGGVSRRRGGSVGVAPPRLRLRERRDEPLATLLGLEKRRGESVGAFGFLLRARERGF